MNSAQPLRLELSGSRPFATLIVGAHAAAAGAFLTVLTGWPAYAAAFLIAALGIAAARDRALLRSAAAARAIEIQPAGQAICMFARGRPADIARPSVRGVNRYWVALPLDSRTRRSLLVTRGMLAPEAFRLLRLWALWGRLPAAALRRQPGS